MEDFFSVYAMQITMSIAWLCGLSALGFVILFVRRVRLKKQSASDGSMPKTYGGLMLLCLLCALCCFWFLC